MLKTRKDLDALAKELREKYEYEGDTAVVLVAHMNSLFTDFVASLPEMTEEEEKSAASDVKAFISIVNDEFRVQYLETLVEMPQKVAFEKFLQNQTVSGFALKFSQKTGEYSVEPDENVPVEFADFLHYVVPAEESVIKDLCCIFADNLIRWNLNRDGASLTNKTVISESYKIMAKSQGLDLSNGTGEVNWSKIGKTAMAEHLTKIVERVFAGTGISPKMLNADVKWISFAILQGRGKANKSGTYVLKNERTIVNAIFRAVYTRVNKLPYDFQDQTNSQKDPFSQAPNKEMGEVSKTEKPAEVTAEKVEEVAA